MNRRNAKMNAYAVDLADVRSSDRVLEIGFGGGVNLPALLQKAVYVAGVDRSEAALRNARRRFAEEIEAGRADFRQGRVEALPFDLETFNKVCTVNTIYFWSSLEAGFTEIYRVLSPNGRATIGFLPKEWMDKGGYPTEIFTPRTPQEVVAAAASARFRDIAVKRPSAATRWNVVVAEK